MTRVDPRPATPGSMTAAMRAVTSDHDSDGSSRIVPETETRLKLALGRGDRLVHTEYIAPREGASVGHGVKNTFVLSRQEHRGPQTRFVELAGDGSTARWSLPPGSHAHWKHGARSGRRDGGEQFVLPSEARVMVRLADGRARIMAEAVEVAIGAEARAVPPVAGDVALVRGGLFRREIDWLLTLCVALSTTFVYGAALYADQMDFLAPPNGVASLPPVRLMFDPPAPAPEPVLPTPRLSEVNAPPNERRMVPHRNRPTAPGDPAPTPNAVNPAGDQGDALRLAAARQRAAESVATVLGAVGGSFDDVLDAPTFSEAHRLLEAPQPAHASASAGRIAARTVRAVPGRPGLGGPRASERGGLAADEGPTAAERPVRITTQRPIFDPTSDFDSRLVSAAIRRRMSGVRRCYERVLTRNPAVSGRLTVRFAVDRHGRFVQTRIGRNATGSEELASCVAGIVGRIRARQGPEGSPVPFTYPFVFRPGD